MNSKFIIFLIVGIITLIVLFFLFKPDVQPAPAPANQNQSDVIDDSKIKTFSLVIKDKKIVSGGETLKINEGDDVIFKVMSDEAGELHIHGYDRSLDLVKNQEVFITFTADLTGRFEFELEQSKTHLGALEVQPK